MKANNGRGNRFLLDDAGSLSVVHPPDEDARRRATRRVASAALDVKDLAELLGMLGLEAREGR